MIARLIRLLCLGCGVLLALPPAWCCYTPSVAQPDPTEPSCCQRKEAPKPAPSPPPAPERCPCCDRLSVSTADPQKVAADVSHAAPVVVVVADSPRAGPSADVAPIPLILSRPLRLLQCVWLC
jgi:hypothetical protein